MNAQKETQYLYFDDLSNEWLPATLSQIAALDNPDLPICPLKVDGTPGPQTTYAAILKRTTAFQRPSSGSATTGSTNTAGHGHKAHTSHACGPVGEETEYNINYTCNYLRAAISLLVFLLFTSAGITLADPRNPEIGLLIGLILGIIALLILKLLTKPSTQK
ncbi:MAG: hypothetical protein IKV92_05330 [Akkermansia sp.]|nr:hypothetical protein [Akkermansia sp.]